jgi:internalin A
MMRFVSVLCAVALAWGCSDSNEPVEQVVNEEVPKVAVNEIVDEGEGEIKPIKTVEDVLRQKLKKPKRKGSLTAKELHSLKGKLIIDDSSITDLSLLTEATNVTALELNGNNITDLSPLANLTKLTWLNLAGNEITDLAPLARLTDLTHLNLKDNRITDLSPLANLSKLIDLGLHGNQVTDLSSLADLSKLTFMDLANNPITDFSLLTKMTNLKALDLRGAPVTDLAPLTGLTQLQKLNLSNTPITDVTLLAKMKNLRELDVSGVPLPDLAPLTELTNLQKLSLDNNQITDLSPLAPMTQLTELNLGNNAVNDLSPLKDFKQLAKLVVASSELNDLAPLSGLTAMRRLEVDWNGTEVASLAGLKQLRHVELHGRRVADLKPFAGLREMNLLSLQVNQPGIDPALDIKPLANLGKLVTLDLKNNRIRDLQPLTSLKRLQYLSIREASFSGSKPLSGLLDLLTSSLGEFRAPKDMSGLRLIVDKEGEVLVHVFGKKEEFKGIDLDSGADELFFVPPSAWVSGSSSSATFHDEDNATLTVSFEGPDHGELRFVGPARKEQILDEWNATFVTEPISADREGLAPDSLLGQIIHTKYPTTLADDSVEEENLTFGPSLVQSHYRYLEANSSVAETSDASWKYSYGKLGQNVARIELKDGEEVYSYVLHFDSFDSGTGRLWYHLNGELSLEDSGEFNFRLAGAFDIGPLANLQQLKEVRLGGENLQNLPSLTKWQNLRKLTLSFQTYPDLAPLEQLTRLENLDLAGSDKIPDLEPLAKMTNLKELRLADNKITNLKPLSGLTKLRQLVLPQNRIRDIFFLSELKSLRGLDLGENQISDLRPLAALTNLQTLDLSQNRIRDRIISLTSLNNLKALSLTGNQRISDAKKSMLRKALPNCKIQF